MPDIKIKRVSEHAIVRCAERNTKVVDLIKNDIIERIRTGIQVEPRSKYYQNKKKQVRSVIHVKSGKLVFVISPEGVVITTLNYTNKAFRAVKD